MQSIKENIETATYDVKRSYCDGIIMQIEKFITVKYGGCEATLGSQLFDLFLDGNHDHQSELWTLKSTAIALMAALANPAIKDLIDAMVITGCVEIAQRIIALSDGLQSEHMIALQDIEMLKGWGTDEINASIYLQEDYAKKLKLAVYEKQLDKEMAN
jgi:hypothetical protein